MMKKVSVIAINYNSLNDTLEFLDSVYDQKGVHLEVIVVDNASDERPNDKIKSKHPDTIVINSSKNLGFAGGNNLAMKQATGEFLFLINNDTILQENTIQNLIRAFSTNQNIGVVCPKIKFYDNQSIIQYAGFEPMNFFTGRTSAIGSQSVDDGSFDKSGFTAGAHGAAMMIRKDVAEQTGYFDESYFLYYEEWDWSVRIKKAGFEIFYEPSATVIHKQSMSVGKANPMKTYYLNRNRLLFILKNAQVHQRIFFGLYFFLIAMPVNLLRFRGKREHQKAIFDIYQWYFSFTQKRDLKLKTLAVTG